MWNVVPLIGTGVALVAFLAAAAAYIYVRALFKKERQIKLAPANERAKLIESALEFFRVDAASLSQKQRSDLAMRQIHERAVRYRTRAVVTVVIAVLLTVISLAALLRGNKTEAQAAPPGTAPSLSPSPVSSSSPLPPPTQTPSPAATSRGSRSSGVTARPQQTRLAPARGAQSDAGVMPGVELPPTPRRSETSEVTLRKETQLDRYLSLYAEKYSDVKLGVRPCTEEERAKQEGALGTLDMIEALATELDRKEIVQVFVRNRRPQSYWRRPCPGDKNQ